jgi:hypothetical protein
MPYRLELNLNLDPMSLNKVLRRHWTERAKQSKAIENLIYFSARKLLPPIPLKRARIAFARHSHRYLDFDGFVGALKPVMDALVRCGVIEDDSWKHVGAWQVFRPKAEGAILHIVVESVEDEPGAEPDPGDSKKSRRRKRTVSRSYPCF